MLTGLHIIKNKDSLEKAWCGGILNPHTNIGMVAGCFL